MPTSYAPFPCTHRIPGIFSNAKLSVSGGEPDDRIPLLHHSFLTFFFFLTECEHTHYLSVYMAEKCYSFSKCTAIGDYNAYIEYECLFNKYSK